MTFKEAFTLVFRYPSCPGRTQLIRSMEEQMLEGYKGIEEEWFRNACIVIEEQLGSRDISDKQSCKLKIKAWELEVKRARIQEELDNIYRLVGKD